METHNWRSRTCKWTWTWWTNSKMKKFTLISLKRSHQEETWWCFSSKVNLVSCWHIRSYRDSEFCSWYYLLSHHLNGDVSCFLFTCIGNEFKHHALIQRNRYFKSTWIHENLNQKTLLLRSFHTGCFSFNNRHFYWYDSRLDHDDLANLILRNPKILLLPMDSLLCHHDCIKHL